MSNHFHEIASFLGGYTHDPLGFVYAVFPWGEGDLKNFEGPDEWQKDILLYIGERLKENAALDVYSVIRQAVASGNGIGKSSMVSWLILWAISTHKETKGIVTAGNEIQLRTKLWAELSKWYNLFLGKPLFVLTATSLYSADPTYEKTWRIDGVPWNVTRSESFAGLHNQGKRLLILMDEASQIEDIIWETVEGALTDDKTEIVFCCFGNPTRPSGKFFDCFHSRRERWNGKNVDSRTVKISNKRQIQEWLDDVDGDEDHDRFRVRVRGEFPRESVDQFISVGVITACVNTRVDQRDYRYYTPVFGVDPSGGGPDKSIICIRQGRYVHPLKKYSGIDEAEFFTKILDTYREFGGQGAICVDGIGIGSGIVAFLKRHGLNVIDVQANERSFDPRSYSNKRSELYGKMRDWLRESGSSIPDDTDLVRQLKGIMGGLNKRGQLQIESKKVIRKELGESPDCVDALVYTFAYDQMRVMSMNMGQSRAVKQVTWA